MADNEHVELDKKVNAFKNRDSILGSLFKIRGRYYSGS